MTPRPAKTTTRFRELKPEKVIFTAKALQSRITSAFPDSNLSLVCKELVDLANESTERAKWMSRPIVALRAAVWLVLIGFAALCLYAFSIYQIQDGPASISDLVQAVEAATNEVILLGAGIFFLLGLEQRLKRARGLEALHELRSMAHIIDMHQLTKDPASLYDGRSGTDSVHLTPATLGRYLDLSSEMLAIIGKIAALYAQEAADGVILSAVDEIESLTTALSRKIWQKIMIAQQTKVVGE